MTSEIRPSTGMTSVVGTAAELFHTLKPQWNALVQGSDSPMPFITWEWYDAWLEAFCLRDQAQLAAVFDGDRLVGVFPFVVQPPWVDLGRQRTLTSWVNTHSFRWGLLCETGNVGAAEKLAKLVAKIEGWDTCLLSFAVTDSPSTLAFIDTLKREGLMVETLPDMQSPVMSVPRDWDEFLGSMPKKRRESERRKCRKIEKLGARYRFVAGSCEDLDALLQDCWAISAKTWKQETGSAIAADDTRKQFYETIANCRDDWLCLSLLYLEEKPVAFEYNLMLNGTAYSLKLGYDVDYAKSSPGQALRFMLFKWCIEQGMASFDFMGHRARYKDQYADRHVDHSEYRVYSKTPRGRATGAYRIRVRPSLVAVKRWLAGILSYRPGRQKGSDGQ